MIYDTSKEYIKYCEDVINGDIKSGRYIKLACLRFKSWFDREDLFFDYSDVDKRIRFVRKMKHSRGKHAGDGFVLLPWQQFAFAGIFGFKYKDTGKRVTKKVLLEISRKNGKTALAAALALVQAAVDNEAGPEVDFIANNRKQARIGFDMCSSFARSLDPLHYVYRTYRDTIKVPFNEGVIQVLSSDSMGQDGWNSSTCIIDEFHAAKTWDLYNVMDTSQQAREQPLIIVITTAGFLLDGYPLFEMRTSCMNSLDGVNDDERFFGLLYELDEKDDYKDESNWIKCSPSLGETVQVDALRDQVLSAQNLPSIEAGIKTKNFNMYVTNKESWLEREDIVKNMSKVDLENYRGRHCYAALDLASRNDLSSLSIMIPMDKDERGFCDLVFKSWGWVPNDTVEKSVNKGVYKRWSRNGELFITDGNVTDYNLIIEKVREINDICPIECIYYDRWNSSQLIIDLTNMYGFNCEQFAQTIGYFNSPTKEFERRLLSGVGLVMDENEVVTWCLCNCALKIDDLDNVRPVKGENRNNKIDHVVSMLMCLGGYMSSNDISPELFVLD